MSIFRTVICPTDLTLECQQALSMAASFAVDDSAKLVVLHCRTGEPVSDTSAVSVVDSAIAEQAGPEHDERGRWQGFVATGGRVAETIVREAARMSADLVVLRSRRRPSRSSLLGSTVEAVCRTAPCPVLVTRPDVRGWLGSIGDHSAPRGILVAYDFWDDAELALRYGLALAERYGAELHLLHVVPAPVRWAADIDLERRLPVVERRLACAVPDSARRRARIVTHVRVGSPYREILSFVEERGIDLVCIGARGRDFGARSLFGSNSDRVLRQAACAVLIARPLKPAVAGADVACNGAADMCDEPSGNTAPRCAANSASGRTSARSPAASPSWAYPTQ